MERLLTKLKRICGNNHVKLTTGIDFNYDEDAKTIHMIMKEGIKGNMQDDYGAFEAWALVLKANLEDSVNHITLDWDYNMEPTDNNTPEWRHFNRFIYRVDEFSKKYEKWFTVLNSKKSWDDRINDEGWETLVLNSQSNRKIIDDYDVYDNRKEHEIELYFANDGSKKLKQAVKEQFNIELGKIKNQYPVGIFNNEVKKENYIFTGGKSAIDLYSTAKDNSFNIFELKGEDNVKVGILSELFFYSSLIRDAVNGKFKSESNELKEIRKVNAFFLVQRIHPLITNKVIAMLNKQNHSISYRTLIY